MAIAPYIHMARVVKISIQLANNYVIHVAMATYILFKNCCVYSYVFKVLSTVWQKVCSTFCIMKELII